VRAPRRGALLATLGVLAVTSSTTVLLSEVPLASLALRVAGIALWLAAAARSGTDDPRRATWSTGLFLAMSLYLVVGNLFHGRWTVGALTLAGALLVGAATSAWLRRLDPAVALLAVRRALTATVTLSLALGVVTPDTALERDRLRGWYENANTLGFAALALGTVVVLRPGRPVPTALALGSSVAALTWSASRTSALAFALVVAVGLVARRSATSLLLTVGAVAAVAGLLAQGAPDVLDGLLRDTDSRSGTTDLALHVLDRWPVTGLGTGIGTSLGIHVSSPLVALIHAGVPGLLSFAAMAAALASAARGRSWRSWTLVAALLLHSTAESWLLSPTSPLLLTAVCLVHGVTGTDVRRRDAAPPAPPTSTALPTRYRHPQESPCPRTSSSSPRTSRRPRPAAVPSAASTA